MPLRGFSLGQVPHPPHLADQPLLAAIFEKPGAHLAEDAE
jgi:hypothetical protein